MTSCEEENHCCLYDKSLHIAFLLSKDFTRYNFIGKVIAYSQLLILENTCCVRIQCRTPVESCQVGSNRIYARSYTLNTCVQGADHGIYLAIVEAMAVFHRLWLKEVNRHPGSVIRTSYNVDSRFLQNVNVLMTITLSCLWRHGWLALV